MALHRVSARPPSLSEQLREIVNARDLFSILVGREIRTRYRQTALGVAWVVLQPLVPALIFAVVFGSFARLPSEGTSYLLFALSGLVIYSLFSNVVSRSSGAFVRDSSLVAKVYFPRALLPLAAGSATLIDFAVGFMVVIVLAVVTGNVPPPLIVLAPLAAATALALSLGLGLAVAALTAHYRDFAIAIPFVLQIALYASPIVYSTELVPPGLRTIYALNPLVGITEAFRAALLGTPAPVVDLALSAVVTCALVLFGVVVYERAARDISDVL